MSFAHPSGQAVNHLDDKMERAAIEAERCKLSPEFINRLDKLVVFDPLKRSQLEELLQIELRKVQTRVGSVTNSPFRFRITEEARQFLIDEGTDKRYWARHMNRAIERLLIHPLARLLATHELLSCDLLIIDRHPAEPCLAFTKDATREVSYRGVPLIDFDASQ